MCVCGMYFDDSRESRERVSERSEVSEYMKKKFYRLMTMHIDSTNRGYMYFNDGFFSIFIFFVTLIRCTVFTAIFLQHNLHTYT